MSEQVDTDAVRRYHSDYTSDQRVAALCDEVDRLRAENATLRDLFCDDVDKRLRLPRSAEVASEQRAALREALLQPDLLGALERSLEAARMERLARKEKDGKQ